FASPALGTAMLFGSSPVFEALSSRYEQLAGIERISTVEMPGNFYPENHDPSTESSECLYLILTEPSLGNSIVADIDRRFIRDSDGDGLPEFVDAWGKPLRFIRWPTDYYAFLI